MKLLVASDIHGSEYYCDKLIAAFKTENPDRMLLLGDILYHGPRNSLPRDYAPKGVIEKLNELRAHILCVRGNCDTEVDQMVLDFPILADYALIFADGITMYATHGHIYNSNSLPSLQHGDVLLCGHTHIHSLQNMGEYYYCNPGSVSLPKNGNTQSYMIYEERKFTIKNMESEIISSMVLDGE